MFELLKASMLKCLTGIPNVSFLSASSARCISATNKPVMCKRMYVVEGAGAVD